MKVTFLLPGPVPYASIHVEREFDEGDAYSVGLEYAKFLGAFKLGLDDGMKLEAQAPAKLVSVPVMAPDEDAPDGAHAEYERALDALTEGLGATVLEELPSEVHTMDDALDAASMAKPWLAQGQKTSPKPWEKNENPAPKGGVSTPQVADLGDWS